MQIVLLLIRQVLLYGMFCTVVSATETSYALIVGVSQYPNLGAAYQLRGPANDADNILRLLVKHYHFDTENIAVLSDSQSRGVEMLPTSANIRREMERVVRKVKKGDNFVFYLAGHGAQQPSKKVGTEIDGLDEIFLPRDVAQWDRQKSMVPNAIIDDEISSWLQVITKKGVHVWAMFDCCHAGNLSRGLKEHERFVSPEKHDGLAIPADVFKNAKQKAEDKNNPKHTTLDLPELKNAAIFYACQSHEKAIELPYLSGTVEEYHGLFTHSLTAVLAKAQRPINYRELNHMIYREYIAVGRTGGPTPLVEGEDIERVVLGNDSISRSLINISIDSNDNHHRQLKIDAGSLHGITNGSVLSVSSRKIGANQISNLIGYVRVTEVNTASATVESCEYSGINRKTITKLVGGECKVIESDYGELKLPIHIDNRDVNGELHSAMFQSKLHSILKELSEKDQSLIKLVSSIDARTWIVRSDGEVVHLISPTNFSYQKTQEEKSNSVNYGSFLLDDTFQVRFLSTLRRIARAENLMRLSTANWKNGSDDSFSPKFTIRKRIKYGDRVVDGGDLLSVRQGDILDMSVTNIGNTEIDLTVLYVNSQMGIKPLFPLQNSVNRIRPRQTRKLPLALFTEGPYGRNHFVFIAVVSDGPNTDFTWLTQNSIPKTRSQNSPIDKLLEKAMFGKGNIRSAQSNSSFTFDILPIDVLSL